MSAPHEKGPAVQGLSRGAKHDFMLWLSEIANFGYKISPFPISDTNVAKG